MRIRYAVSLAACSLMAVSCGSGDDNEPLSTPTTSAASTTSSSTDAAFVAEAERLGVDPTTAAALIPAGEASCSYAAAGYSYTDTQAEVAGEFGLNSRQAAVVFRAATTTMCPVSGG